MQYNNTVIEQEVFVICGLHKALIGLPAIEALGLVSRVNNIVADTPARFPKLFDDLGCLPGEYTICLSDNAKPFAIATPRRVALPLLPKVKNELERMEKTGVISRVDAPTEWCTGIVVVQKSDGQIRICVDLTKLNESVQREKHPIPSVEHILAQLGEAKVFSKLAGFWQFTLLKESALLTTFITPFAF